jgi:hypothetical protein
MFDILDYTATSVLTREESTLHVSAPHIAESQGPESVGEILASECIIVSVGK